MKPICKSLLIEAEVLSISLSLQAQVTSGETVATQDVQAESLEGLKVVLVSPNVSGAKDLIESGECELDGANLLINLNNLTQGVHRVQVSAVFGTQTVVLYAIDLTVPVGRLSDETQEFEDEVIVVSTIGDGDVSGADASVYAKDGDGNAHITKPLSIGDGVASGDGAVASGSAYGENSSIQAGGDGAVASGSADDGSSIQAGGAGAVASGSADNEVGNILANGDGSMAVGIGVQATQDGQAVVGKCNVVDEDDTFQFIVGNGADDEHRSNGFAVTKSGELALFKADGTPIYLDASKLEALIAMLPTT